MNTTLIALGAAVAAFWNQAKAFAQKVVSIFIRSERLGRTLSVDFLKEIHKKSKKIGFGNYSYYRASDYNKDGQLVDFYFRSKSSFLVFYKNKYPAILLGSENDFKITYIAGTFPLAEIIKPIAESFSLSSDKRHGTEFYITRLHGENKKDAASQSNAQLAGSIGKSQSAKDGSFFDFFNAKDWIEPIGIDLSIFEFNRKTKKRNFFWHETGLKVKSDVEYWLNSSEWYSERGIAWRRGCLLYGNAGSGKSKLISEVCSNLNIPLRIFDISSMDNEDFTKYFQESPKGSVVLIEDIDTVFDGRENILQKTRINDSLLTFDCLINNLSGAKQTNGVYVFITTNNIEKLDSALIRSGRIDSKYEIPELGDEGKRFIANNILKGFEYLIDDVVFENQNKTAAEFENICVELAKSEYWKNFG